MAEKLNATVVDMRFVKPIDEARILEVANTHDVIVTLEENAIQGGAGSAVSEVLNSHGKTTALFTTWFYLILLFRKAHNKKPLLKLN